MTEERYIVWVAAEYANVFLHPTQHFNLIQYGYISAGISNPRILQMQKTFCAETTIAGHEYHALGCEICAVVRWQRARP